MTLQARQAMLILNGLPGIGPITVKRLLETYKEPQEIFDRAANSPFSTNVREMILNWQKHFDVGSEEKKMARLGVRFIISDDAEYPQLLRQISNPPTGLYARGKSFPLNKCIAIVGSRRATLYGLQIARQLASELARSGFCIVSGLARGVDAAAHEGALQANGKTVAVLGCGVDIIYPPENKALYEQIAAKGLLLSEFPMGRSADRITFPMRNRLIAGMCHGIIVVESDQNGGSMLTASFAADQGRLVFAVPGRVDQPTSRGCHKLIREGAILTTSAHEVLEELGQQPLLPTELPISPSNMASSPPLNDIEKKLMQYFAQQPSMTIDTLAEGVQMPAQEVSAHLLMLELKKCVARRSDGFFERL